MTISPVSRRRFLRTATGTATAAVLSPLLGDRAMAASHPDATAVRSTAVRTSDARTAAPTIPAGFPTASSTGVQAQESGFSLKPTAGPVTVTTAGAVLDGLDISGALTIRAPGVIVTRCRIRSGHSGPVATVVSSKGGSAQFSFCEIDGLGTADVGLSGATFSAFACDIHSAGDGVHPYDRTSLVNCYVHDLATQANLHHDCVQTLKGDTATSVLVSGCTLLNIRSDGSQGNSCFHIGTGMLGAVTLQANYLDGGTYMIQGEGEQVSELTIVANGFGRDRHYGNSDFSAKNRPPGIVWAGNYYADDKTAAPFGS
jgi:hypothetical protein